MYVSLSVCLSVCLSGKNDGKNLWHARTAPSILGRRRRGGVNILVQTRTDRGHGRHGRRGERRVYRHHCKVGKEGREGENLAPFDHCMRLPTALARSLVVALPRGARRPKLVGSFVFNVFAEPVFTWFDVTGEKRYCERTPVLSAVVQAKECPSAPADKRNLDELSCLLSPVPTEY